MLRQDNIYFELLYKYFGLVVYGLRLTQHKMEVRHTQLYLSTCFTQVTAGAKGSQIYSHRNT